VNQVVEEKQDHVISLNEHEILLRIVRMTGDPCERQGRDAYLYALPNYSHDQQVIAALVLEKWTVQYPVHEQDRRFLHNLTGLVSSNIENGIMYEAMITDNLTGLYTRNYFMKRLNEEFGKVQRYGIDLSFLMINLDNFSAAKS
jgi:predicted signal transduction protein with EAL and GGDEF domain